VYQDSFWVLQDDTFYINAVSLVEQVPEVGVVDWGKDNMFIG
jgi:hypothetical protein